MIHEVHYPILSQLGINDSEALVYELLLELGPKPAQDLLVPSGLGRGNLYNVMASLKKKGLIFEESGAKTVFKAADPETLRRLAQAKVAASHDLLNQLSAALPTLKSQYNLVTKRPTVRMFEGIDSLKEIYRETLEDKKTIFALVGPDDPAPEIFRWLSKTYGSARAEKGIYAYVVASGEKNIESYVKSSKEQMRSVATVDHDLYDFHGEIDVFGDKVAFISYKKEELIGTIIESSSLAATLRSAIKFILSSKGIVMPPEEVAPLVAQPSS
ncbi:MAG: helix-turn-helix domain-containing protein [Patescibacteria group bacterium]